MDEHGLDWLVCLAVQRLQSVLVHELRFPLYVMAMQLFESCDIHSKRNLRKWLCRFPSTFLSSPLHPSLDFPFLIPLHMPKKKSVLQICSPLAFGFFFFFFGGHDMS